MGILDFFSWGRKSGGGRRITQPMCAPKNNGTTSYQYLALDAAIGLIANAVSSASIDTYYQNKKTKKNNWYLLNVRPNLHQTATQFRQSLIRRLIKEGEVLVVMRQDMHGEQGLYIADSYNYDSTQRYAYQTPLHFHNVVVDGYVYKDPIHQDDVLHIVHPDADMLRNLSKIYDEQAQLANAAKVYYKQKNAKRYQTTDMHLSPQTEDDYDDRYDLIMSQMDEFTDPDVLVSVRLNQKDTKLEELGNSSTSASTTDYIGLINEYTRYVAMATHVPHVLLTQSTADITGAYDTFLTNCVQMYLDLIDSEINRKMYSKAQVLQSTCVRTDIMSIVRKDKVGSAANYEALLRIGVLTPNDVRRDMGYTPIDDPSADAQILTKNYDVISTNTNTNTNEGSGTL